MVDYASMQSVLHEALINYDEFIYFPSIGWNHSWERQQTLITAFCNAHAPKVGLAVAPTGLIDHKLYSISSLSSLSRIVLNRNAKLATANANHLVNSLPFNLNYLRPGFSRGTNPFFASLALLSNNQLRDALVPRARRLVFASYVNPLVQRFLETADLSILDLAERRQANIALSESMRQLERHWAARCDLLVADSEATLADYRMDRALAGKTEGYYIPQGFEPPSTPKALKKYNLIAAYLGNLHHAIDYDYFQGLIDKNPDWTFKLCGQLMTEEARKLLSRPNVNYIGVISNSQIAEFLSDASIGLIPYRRSDWTDGVFPTKLFEYLSHYVPVLSTSLPEVSRYARSSSFIKISNSVEKLNLLNVNKQEINSFISEHTWQQRIQVYAKAISQVEK